MVFKAGPDPNRNTKGAPTKEERERKERESSPKSKLRRVRGSLAKHVDDAILEAATIMKTAAKEETKLKAAMFIVQEYINTHVKTTVEEKQEAALKNIKAPEDGEDVPEETGNIAEFSLNLVSNNE